ASVLKMERSRTRSRDAVVLAEPVGAGDDEDQREQRHPQDAANDAFDDVAPVRIHVEDHAAAAGAVIPARALAGLLAAVEHPPAELELESRDTPERASPRERGELLQSREMDLVFDHAVLDAAPLRLPQQGHALRGGRGQRLFAIDVLVGRDCLLQHGDAALRRRRVEEDGVGGGGGRRGGDGGGGRAASRWVVQSATLWARATAARRAASRPASSKRGTHRSSPSASPPSAMIGIKPFARCWVEPMRPVAPLTMMPIVWLAIVQFRCDAEGEGRASLVSRFRSLQALAAHVRPNFGIKGTLANL